MEELVYIVLIVVWLLVSFLKRKPKKADKPADTQQPAQGETDSGSGREVTMEDMLEEFFGSDKKKEKPEKPEPVFDASERKRDDDYERLEDRREKDLLDQRDETPIWEQQEKQIRKDPKVEEHEGKAAVSKDYEFAPEKKQQTIEELIASHKKEEALRLVQEESYDHEGVGIAGFPDFDLRTAVIFSEILNKKYD